MSFFSTALAKPFPEPFQGSKIQSPFRSAAHWWKSCDVPQDLKLLSASDTPGRLNSLDGHWTSDQQPCSQKDELRNRVRKRSRASNSIVDASSSPRLGKAVQVSRFKDQRIRRVGPPGAHPNTSLHFLAFSFSRVGTIQLCSGRTAESLETMAAIQHLARKSWISLGRVQISRCSAANIFDAPGPQLCLVPFKAAQWLIAEGPSHRNGQSGAAVTVPTPTMVLFFGIILVFGSQPAYRNRNQRNNLPQTTSLSFLQPTFPLTTSG
ncbi:uncharacterized protein BJX67DRAFT_91531 [Aspergillus lucknowensis]|uniref:Uncharacterized protein n=1 Tax=Aspergillus lucknowensis TaxID=176173 RepID=A0ABR4M5L9_9EURO